MVKCSFCGKEKKSFQGIFLLKNSGVVEYFCSSKCRKNSLKLHRDKRKLKWTEAYRIAKEKERANEKVEEKVSDEKKE